jgi:putative membrane protein
MWANAIAAYLHYLSLGLIFASLSTELFTLKQDLTNKEGWRILIADSVYGLAGITILVTGILRFLYFEKGADYYNHQPVFWMKMSVFIVVGLLSLYPTFSFLMWIKELRAEKPPAVSPEKIKTLKTIIHVELFGFSLIPLLASMMSRGIGANWFN